jgi:molecular chaperone GrpE
MKPAEDNQDSKEQEAAAQEPPAETSDSSTEAQSTNDLETELTRYRDLALRSRADLENFRKRMMREKEESVKYANTSLLERLLPVLDNFELGLDAAKTSNDTASILQGFQMVQKQLQDFLKDNGVEAVEATGGEFDPNLHEAVAHEPSDEAPEGRVIQQLRRGYKLRDRLLRPATVVVSKGGSAKHE